MYRATAVIFSVVCALTSSCAQVGKQEERIGPFSKIILGEYDKVWRAAQKALTNYPIRTNNIETGIIETDTVRGLNVWTPPHKPHSKEPGLRYYMRMTMIRGDVKGKPSVEINIEKIKTVEKSFFAEEKRLPSDGLEEESIVYRVERELMLERSLDKAFQNNKI